MERTPKDQPVLAHGARRRRPLLLTLTALGVTTGLLGFAGVLAVGSDRATTGLNDVNTPELAGEDGLDIVLALATYEMASGTFTCGTDYDDDLESGVVTSDGSDLSTQYPVFTNYDEGYLCLRNDSDVPVDISASTFDVVDSELACSPGEADVDASCGEGEGELSSHLQAQFFTAVDGEEGACYDTPVAPGTIADLEDGEVTADLGTVDPGEVLGICPGVAWDLDPVSQTDEVQWRYAFDAVESDGGEPVLVDCAEDDGWEQNDSLDAPAAGYTLAPGAAIGATVCEEDPNDYFAAGSDDAGSTVVSVTWGDAATDIDLYVYDDAGVLVAQSTDVGTTEESVEVLVSDIAVVRVVHYEGPASTYIVGLSEPFGAP